MHSEPTVFVVDDDEAMRHSLEWLITSAGLRTQSFGSAEEFLRTYYPGQAGCVFGTEKASLRYWFIGTERSRVANQRA